VVVGSGVYMNRWLKPGTDFLKEIPDDACDSAIWLSAVGPPAAPKTPTAASRPRLRARRRRPVAKGVGKWRDRLRLPLPQDLSRPDR
jgi:hypothetical protein